MRNLLFGLILVMACGDDDRPPLDGSVGGDAGSVDGGGDADASAPDASTPDASPPSDASVTVDAGPASMANVELTFGGCAPDFRENVVVVRNAESVAVSATSGGGLTGSIQLALEGLSGVQMLSTQHRVDTGGVVNVIIGTTWTNIARDSAGVLGGSVADPIGGTLRIDAYDRAAATMDLTFTGVTLQNPSNGTICSVDGRLRTFGPSF